jgi:hypothetical protein
MEDPAMPMADTDAMDSLRTLTEALVKNQEILAETYERRVAAEERKAGALEDIAEYLRILSTQSSREEDQDYVDDQQRFASTQEDAEVFPETGNLAAGYPDDEEEEPVRIQAPVKRTYIRRTPAERAAAKADAAGRETVKVLKRTRAQKLEAMAQSGNQAPQATPVTPSAPAGDTPGILSREEVMTIIQDMRDQGATFDQVAQHFKSLGQPTFSGRGDWHAQTVHRLCNRS